MAAQDVDVAGNAPSDKQAVWKARGRVIYRKVMDQWFIWGLGLAIAFAAAWPALGKTNGHIQAQYSIKYTAVIIIFLCTGMSLKTRVLANAVAQYKAHFLTQAISLGIIPAVGYGVAYALYSSNLNKDLIDGLIIAAAMPTTVSTNVVFTKSAGGNEALAVVNAVVGNIIGIFITPALLSAYLKRFGSAPISNVMRELSITVLAPMAVGQVLQFFAPKQVKWLQSKVNFSKVGNFCILLLVWSTFCNTFAQKNIGVDFGSVVVIILILEVLLITFAGLCVSVSSAPLVQELLDLDRADAVAITFVGATKTVALGVPLINVLYGADAKVGILTIPLLVYHASQIFLGGLAVPKIRKWQENDPSPKVVHEEEVQGRPDADDAAQAPAVADVEAAADGEEMHSRVKLQPVSSSAPGVSVEADSGSKAQQ